MPKPYNRASILDDVKSLQPLGEGAQDILMVDGTPHLFDEAGARPIALFDFKPSGSSLRRQHTPSTQYQAFDFSAYIDDILTLVERSITPAYYFLECKKGVQEINIITAPVTSDGIDGNVPLEIRGDQYCMGFYILNSTDMTRALQFSVGLYRVSSGSEVLMHIHPLVLEKYNIKTDVSCYAKLVHKGKLFSDKIAHLGGFISKMELLVTLQLRALEELEREQVSMKALYTRMLYENSVTDKEGVHLASASRVRTQSFARQLMRGDDRLMLGSTHTESAEDFADLVDPVTFLKRAKSDVRVNAYQALMCHLNAYRSRDTSVLRRESRRFIEYVYDINYPQWRKKVSEGVAANQELVEA